MDPDVPKPGGDAEARVTERLRQADDADHLSVVEAGIKRNAIHLAGA